MVMRPEEPTESLSEDGSLAQSVWGKTAELNRQENERKNKDMQSSYDDDPYGFKKLDADLKSLNVNQEDYLKMPSQEIRTEGDWREHEAETKKLQDILKSLKSNVPSKVVRIKLNEVVNLLNELKKKHVVQDKDVLTMLRYYELVNELKKIGDK